MRIGRLQRKGARLPVRSDVAGVENVERAGRHRGGAGLVREIELLAPATVTLLGERRALGPPGLAGGEPGQVGVNRWLRADGRSETLAATVKLDALEADQIEIATPGGGGFGLAKARDR